MLLCFSWCLSSPSFSFFHTQTLSHSQHISLSLSLSLSINLSLFVCVCVCVCVFVSLSFPLSISVLFHFLFFFLSLISSFFNFFPSFFQPLQTHTNTRITHKHVFTHAYSFIFCTQSSRTQTKADVVFAVTCAIRENAERKVWQRLDLFRKMKRTTRKHMQIGVLGCMAGVCCVGACVCVCV